jgi:hypothetical protein
MHTRETGRRTAEAEAASATVFAEEEGGRFEVCI